MLDQLNDEDREKLIEDLREEIKRLTRLGHVCIQADSVDELKQTVSRIDERANSLREGLSANHDAHAAIRKEFDDKLSALALKVEKLAEVVEKTHGPAVQWIETVRSSTSKIIFTILIAFILGTVTWLVNMFGSHYGAGK